LQKVTEEEQQSPPPNTN